ESRLYFPLNGRREERIGAVHVQGGAVEFGVGGELEVLGDHAHPQIREAVPALPHDAGRSVLNAQPQGGPVAGAARSTSQRQGRTYYGWPADPQAVESRAAQGPNVPGAVPKNCFGPPRRPR